MMAIKQPPAKISDSIPGGMTNLLPVTQFEHSHDLKFDPMAIKDGMLSVLAPPYQAMSVGDKVLLSVEFTHEDIPIAFPPLTRQKTLTETDIGRPLLWNVEPSNFFDYADFRATFSYSVVYAIPTVPTLSEKQEWHLVEPSSSLLPPPAIKDYDSDMLDPEAHPKGIVLNIALYPGIQVGDDVMLYARGNTLEVKTVRVDQSTIDSEILHIRLDYEWLSANTGLKVSLMYQYARVGSAGTSTALLLNLRQPLHLPHPIIEGAEREGEDEEYKVYLLGDKITGGIFIEIPPEAVISEEDKVQMIFEGHGSAGKYVAEPSAGNSRRFFIPPQYVPANLGKRLFVFYQVTPSGESAYPSKPMNLRINDLPGNQWRPIQIVSPPGASNTKVSLATVTTSVDLRLNRWTYIAQGQRVRIIAKGLLQSEGQERFDIRVGDVERVTEAEFNRGTLEVSLPRTFLAKLRLNVSFDVTVEISFDDGFSYKTVPQISPQLVA